MSTLDQVQASAVVKFSASVQAQALVAAGDLGQDSDGMKWVFQGADDDRPFRDPEGTGRAAVVFTVNDTWGVNRHNTASMPILVALVYADASRNSGGELLLRDAKARAQRVSAAIRDVFHDVGNVDHDWPLEVKVFSCVCSSDVSVLPVPATEAQHRASLRFEVML